VQTEPQRFTRVAPLDRRAARDAFPIVAAIHALAAELGVSKLTASDLEAMSNANARFARALKDDDVDAALDADDAFHAVLLIASANVELVKTLERLMPRLRRLERLRFGSLAGRGSVRQHDAILGAAGQHDITTTAERVRENWLSLGTLIDRSFE
jgi:DNA-binding GntR family transcriptional regulator